tara:strand:- start:13 stop:618 length:606 start_codon:yes stop_codon:yes gene_type:complete
MTVRISKPEFNLREKLSELDYDRVPFQKMPAGSVVQTVVNYPESEVVVKAHQPGGSNVFAETPDGQYRTTIHPMFANSLLLLDLTFLFGGNNSSNISGFKFMQSPNTDMSSAVDLSNNASYAGGGNRQFTHGSSRQKDYDGNDRHTMHISAMTPAVNTEARTYSLYHYSEGNTTKYFNATVTDNTGCSFSPWRFTIREIRQ